MTEYIRDELLGVDAIEVSDHLQSKGLECVIRTGEQFVIAGDFTAATLDAALADFLPLTSEQIATIDRLRASGLLMDLPTYDLVRPDLQTLRDLRQTGRNAFMGLSATERDRLMYDAFTATTRIFLAILREP